MGVCIQHVWVYSVTVWGYCIYGYGYTACMGMVILHVRVRVFHVTMGIPHVRYDLSYCTDLHSYDGGSDTDQDVTVVQQKVPQRVVTALQVCDTRLDPAPPRHCLCLHHVIVFVFITSLCLHHVIVFVFITSLGVHHVIVFITSLSLSSSRHFVLIASLCLCLHHVTAYLCLSRNYVSVFTTSLCLSSPRHCVSVFTTSLCLCLHHVTVSLSLALLPSKHCSLPSSSFSFCLNYCHRHHHRRHCHHRHDRHYHDT